MKILQANLSHITVGTDRVELSVPAMLYTPLISCLYRDGTNDKAHEKDGYLIIFYTVRGVRVIISKMLANQCQNQEYERAYIRVLNPTTEFQKYLKELLSSLVLDSFFPLTCIKIKQVEVKYDLYDKNYRSEKDASVLKNFIDHHLVVKRSRVDSCARIKGTNYHGRGGNIRKGNLGTRCYVKENRHSPGTYFSRLEFQYNADYLYQHKMTIHDLPLNPLNFNSFSHVDFLGDCSVRGLKNISKAILKKEGVLQNDDRKFYSQKHREMVAYLTKLIVKTGNNRKRTVHDQISSVKQLKNNYEFTMNHKNYFGPLEDMTQLVVCHADISVTEDASSKRMVFCQA